MKNVFACTFLSLCLLILHSPAQASSAADEIKEGNRLYKEKKYDKAIEQYTAAKEISPDSDIANFNLGAALYKKGQYGESIDAFTKALNTEDQKIESDAIYNIANAKYRLGGVTADKDLNSAVNLYRESLDYYKRAIELDENNKDAKYNHELVERELKVLLDKLKNQPQQDQQNQDQGQEDKKGDQQSKTHSGEDKEEKKEQGKKDEQSAEKEYQEDTGSENPEQQQDSAPAEKKTQEMSPEEARMLLDAYGEEEAMDNIKKIKKGYYPEVLKDW